MPRRRTTDAVVLALACALLDPASAAEAYLIDLNDASVVDHGSMALELQPIGYYQTLLGEEDHELIAPSVQLYWGLAEGWDVLYVSRGFALLDDAPDESAYSIDEQMLGFRVMLRDGVYCCTDEADGPSVTLQLGALLPGIEGGGGVGASVALLLAQEWPEGTLHGNVWLNLTRELTYELFLSVVYEMPSSWDFRPTAELWFDLYDGEPLISGLLGAIGDVNDQFSIQAGVRVSGWEDTLDLEVRVSSWIEWEVWDPSGGADDDEDEPDGDASSALRGRPPDAWRTTRAL